VAVIFEWYFPNLIIFGCYETNFPKYILPNIYSKNYIYHLSSAPGSILYWFCPLLLLHICIGNFSYVEYPAVKSWLHHWIPGTLKLQPSSISIVSIPQKRCISNLSNVGLVLGSNSNIINLSINALKRVKVDRTTVTPNQKETKRLGVGENPFAASDDEDTENDGTLLEHLVKEITDVGLDDLYLDTKICDLMVTGRKSKASSKKRKNHQKVSHQNVSP